MQYIGFVTHHHHNLFSFRRSVQDYKIQMDMEIVTFEGKTRSKTITKCTSI